MSTSNTELPEPEDYFVAICYGDNQQHKVLKSALINHSEVLKQQLESKKVTIKDVSSLTVEVFIDWLNMEQVINWNFNVVELFILTAEYKVNKLLNECIERLKSTLNDRNVKKAFFLAVKYDVETLKSECIQYLNSTLCDQNFGNRFLFAFDNSCIELQKHIIEYIDNTSDWYEHLIKSSRWKRFIKTDNEEAKQILDILLTKKCIRQMISTLNDQNFGNRLILANDQKLQLLQQNIISYAKHADNWWKNMCISSQWKYWKWKNPEEADFLIEQLVPDHLKDPKFIFDYIQNQIQIGHTRNQTFAAFYHKFFNRTRYIEVWDVELWFKNFNDVNNRKLTREHYDLPFFHDLAIRINRQFKMAERVTVSDLKSTMNYYCIDLCFINIRYALYTWYSKPKQYCDVFLVDTLSNEKRLLKIDNDVHISHTPKIISLHSGYFLISTRDNAYLQNVYLVKLDVETLECVMVDKKQLKGFYSECIVDSEDKNKFAIIVSHNNSRYLHRGKMIGFQLQFEEEMVQFSVNAYMYLKLSGNTIYGIRVNQNNISLSEFTITGNQISSQEVCNVNDPNNLLRRRIYLHGWVGDTCYFIQQSNNKHYLIECDFETKQINKVKCFEYMTTISDFLIEDGILFLCARNGRNHASSSFYRVSFKQPDKLASLAIKQIEKQLIFANKETYDKFVQHNIPKSFRPFGQFD